MSATARVGVGGWTFAPWWGVFYPDGLPHRDELSFAARALSSIEINATYYATFKPATWRNWHDATPDDFLFAVKAPRACTNRKRLTDAGACIARFVGQGLVQLGPKLGPLNWQFMPTKRFDPDDFEAFLSVLPKSLEGRPLRHAIDVRHPSFACQAFYDLARKYAVAIVHTISEDFPKIDQATADFTYTRLIMTQPGLERGLSPADIRKLARSIRTWTRRGDVFAYLISGAKVRNPAAALAVMEELSGKRDRILRRA